MKTISCLIFVTFVVASVLACNVDENNKPTCSSANVKVPVRNFWDPTGYWLCNSASGTAEMVRCPDANLYDSALGKCVLWNEWVWTNPCPETN